VQLWALIKVDDGVHVLVQELGSLLNREMPVEERLYFRLELRQSKRPIILHLIHFLLALLGGASFGFSVGGAAEGCLVQSVARS